MSPGGHSMLFYLDDPIFERGLSRLREMVRLLRVLTQSSLAEARFYQEVE